MNKLSVKGGPTRGKLDFQFKDFKLTLKCISGLAFFYFFGLELSREFKLIDL